MWSRHYILGLLILDNSEKACLCRAISAAQDRAVNVLLFEWKKRGVSDIILGFNVTKTLLRISPKSA